MIQTKGQFPILYPENLGEPEDFVSNRLGDSTICQGTHRIPKVLGEDMKILQGRLLSIDQLTSLAPSVMIRSWAFFGASGS